MSVQSVGKVFLMTESFEANQSFVQHGSHCQHHSGKSIKCPRLTVVRPSMKDLKMCHL